MVPTNALILPTGSRYGKYWAEDLRRELDKTFQFVYVHNYWHWGQLDDRNLDIYKECGRVKEWRDNMGENFVIIAIAEGVIAALKSIVDSYVQPKACIFIGYPYTWTRHLKFDDECRKWLSALNIPVLFIQAEFDPFLDFEHLDDFVTGYVKNKQVLQLQGSDPNYDNIYQLSQIINDFVNKNVK